MGIKEEAAAIVIIGKDSLRSSTAMIQSACLPTYRASRRSRPVDDDEVLRNT